MTKRQLILLIAVVYILPKVQPTWPGMIVRCEQPITSGEPLQGMQIRSLTNAGIRPPCADGKCLCNWECENGVQSDTVVIDGNQTVKPTGCTPKTGNYYYGITPTGVR